MTPTDIRVKLSKAVEPFVLAIDIGSTASRGDVYDATGRSLRGGRVKVPHQFTSRSDGTSEIDPDAVVVEVEQIITAFANRPFAGRVQAVALTPSLPHWWAWGRTDEPGHPASPMPTRAAPTRSYNFGASWTRWRFSSARGVGYTRAI